MNGEKDDGVIVGVFTHDEYHTVLDALWGHIGFLEKQEKFDEARATNVLWHEMAKLIKETENV